MIPRLPYLGMPYYNRYSRYGYRYPYYSYKTTKDSFSNDNSINDKHTMNYNDNYENLNKKREINRNNNAKNSRNGFSNTYASNNTSTSDNSIGSNANDVRNSKQSNDENDKPLFQIFGINLFFDDILLICLIWFLYDEGVKDEGLFIALILLLLS